MRSFVILVWVLGLLCLPVAAHSQDEPSAQWDGVWIAEGTLFTIAVEVSAGRMQITRIETLGFEWTHEDGEVTGNTVTVPVVYAGVTGVVQADLIDSSTAIAFAATCMPDFMVVCALAKGRHAVFRKVVPDSQ